MTTIATFTKPEEAHLVKMRLEAAGIEAVILDENVIQIDMLFSNAMGGVRLQVADEAVADAREFLAADVAAPAAPRAERCPKCGSTVIASERFSRRLAYLSLLLLGIPFLFFRRRNRCESCLHTWKEPQGSPLPPENPRSAETNSLKTLTDRWLPEG